MFGAPSRSSGALAFLDRPSSGALTLAVVAALLGWAYHAWSERANRPGPIAGAGDRRPDPIADRIETPAVVALLTNGYRVPSSAITATVVDLAARGWLRIAVVDDELVVVTKGQGAAGDTLRPYEQHVLNHVASRAFNDMSSAGTLAVSQRRLDRRWRLRFGHAVADHARQLGLCAPRYSLATLAPSAIAAATAIIALAWSVTRGTDVALADSWRSRLLALATLVVAAGLAWATYLRVVGSEQRPTDAGLARTVEWLGYRRRLRARIPQDATVLATPQQLSALAIASVMGVAEQVHEQLPVAREDAGWAWSEAGEQPKVIRVHYPTVPGYGQHPLRVAIVGLLLLVVARWVRERLQDIADGRSLQSLLDKVPGQTDLIESLASILAVACWIPMLLGIWALVAGSIDLVATRERIGLVVRTRRPGDVVPYGHLLNPLADRDRFSTYLAVDDGRRATVIAWLASERTAAPQGAQARVRATPLLGFVRSSEPVGTAARRG